MRPTLEELSIAPDSTRRKCPVAICDVAHSRCRVTPALPHDETHKLVPTGLSTASEQSGSEDVIVEPETPDLTRPHIHHAQVVVLGLAPHQQSDIHPISDLHRILPFNTWSLQY